MKLKIILSLLVLLLTVSSSYASFPVKRVKAATTNEISNNTKDSEEATMLITPAASSASKEMTTALLLWFFLGGFAAHRWYLGSPVGWNILFILTAGGIGVWWIIDGIDIMTEKYPGL